MYTGNVTARGTMRKSASSNRPATKLECLECGRTFSRKLPQFKLLSEVKCPKCGGYDVEVVG